MSTTAVDVAIRPYEQRDEADVLRLLHAALAAGPTGSRTADFFRWKHHANPFGPSFAWVATSGADLVGVRLFLRWEFLARGGVVRAVRAVDTATHPSMQGRGIFRSLTLAAVDELRAQTDVVFNTPNAASLPGYLKMGWREVGRVPIAVRPVRPVRFVRHARPSHRGAAAAGTLSSTLPKAAEVLSDGNAIETLLAEAGGDAQRLSTRRSLHYLRWRYGGAPGLDYRAIPALVGNELAGVAFGRLRHRGPLTELTLSEVLVRAGDRRTARRLLLAATSTGADHVATHLPPGSDAAAAGRRSGYVALPRLGMTLVANPLRAFEPDATALSSWRFALGDLEVF